MEIVSILKLAFDHAFFDTLRLIPFLFVTYWAMEALEHHAGEKSEAIVRKAGAAGSLIGAILGAVPQCGFSTASATLYAARVVSLGTLLAVFLSTSDEMLPIFIAEQAPLDLLFKILGIKIVIGMLVGFTVDAVLRMRNRANEALRIHELCKRDHCRCNGDCATCEAEPQLAYGYEQDTEHEHNHTQGSIIRSALVHTAQVVLFVFVVSFALEMVIESVGESTLASFIAGNPVVSVVASCVVGLIPNCAASVVITELYLDGALGVGAMLGGLLVSSGVGLLVLFRTNRPMSKNFIVVGILLAVGVCVGLVGTAAGLNL